MRVYRSAMGDGSYLVMQFDYCVRPKRAHIAKMPFELRLQVRLGFLKTHHEKLPS